LSATLCLGALRMWRERERERERKENEGALRKSFQHV
jgi:hypothetical protein